MENKTVFISYSHKDTDWKDRLVTHLKATQITQIVPWDDTMIQTGDNWLAEIYRVMEHSSIAILLVSSDFLSSDFIKKNEVPRLLLRQSSAGVRLLPLIVRPCPWKLIDWLSLLQARPWEGKPLTSLSENDAEACLSSIAEEVVKLSELNSVPYLPETGSMITPSIPYDPARLIGLKLNNNDPLCLDFIMTLGDESSTNNILYSEAATLVDYFLTCLAIPENDLWVNLSPIERDRVIPATLAKTRMGKDLLAQDYLLKQFNASLMYPEFSTGIKYWRTVYKRMEENHRSSKKPINTFNKVWIVPEVAKVSQFGGLVLTTDECLDVLLEEDYNVLKNSLSDSKYGMSDMSEKDLSKTSSISSSAFSECLLSEIKKEVNTGCHFATTRQIFHSLILSRWYKCTIKDSLINDVYSDKEKTSGLEEEDNEYATKIFNQYVEAMSKGVFNFIREDEDPISGEIIPRKYFSGGILASAIKEKLEIDNANNEIQVNDILGRDHKCYLVKVRLIVGSGRSSEPGMGNNGCGAVGGIDLTVNNLNISEYGEKFKYNIDEDHKRKIFSDEFNGFSARIENILPLNSINEMID